MNIQTISAGGREGSTTLMARAHAIAAKGRRPFVYGALVTFSALYYYRPEDFIPGLNYIPMARIVGVIGAVGLIVGMMGGGIKSNVPRAVKVLWLLLLQMALCVPFAIWRGGAIAIVFGMFA